MMQDKLTEKTSEGVPQQIHQLHACFRRSCCRTTRLLPRNHRTVSSNTCNIFTHLGVRKLTVFLRPVHRPLPLCPIGIPRTSPGRCQGDGGPRRSPCIAHRGEWNQHRCCRQRSGTADSVASAESAECSRTRPDSGDCELAWSQVGDGPDPGQLGLGQAWGARRRGSQHYT